jgi:hypothetical protein
VTAATRRWLAAAFVALFAVWMLAPAVTPIYDGIGNPDEPYRFVKPPPTAKTTKAPTAAKAIVAVRNGLSGAQFANSAELGPQISVYVPPGALQVPAGATTMTVTATPLAPSPPLPSDGTIMTNVYRIGAAAGGQPVQVIGRGNQEPSVQMRSATAAPSGPVFERRTATGWQRLKTTRVGNDVYQTAAATFGDYALVQPAHPAQAKKSGGVNVGLLAGGLAILVLTFAILGIRMRRTRRVGP